MIVVIMALAFLVFPLVCCGLLAALLLPVDAPGLAYVAVSWMLFSVWVAAIWATTGEKPKPKVEPEEKPVSLMDALMEDRTL